MKPPPCMPLLLLFSTLWIEVSSSECSNFPKSNIVLSEMSSLRTSTLLGTYINHSENPRVILSCYHSENIPVVMVTNGKGDHIVTIKNFPCDEKGNFIENTYMSHQTKGKDNILILGILPPEENEGVWCQYNICYSCGKLVLSMAVSREQNLNMDTKLFRWSEKGIPVVPTYDFRLNSYGKVKAEFLSIGSEKFVLTCYETEGIVIRTADGLEIVKIKDLKCYPDEYIQTFYAFAVKKEAGWRPNFISQYQLAKEMKPDFSWHLRDGVDIVFYYFSASVESQLKMCYWKKVNLQKPNTCPSIADDRIELNSKYYDKILAQFNYDNVVTYQKSVGLKLMYFEMNGEDKEQGRTLVVTDHMGGHILTLKNVKNSAMELFSRNYFIHTKYNDKDVKHIVLGTRWDVDDDWCTYSIYRANEDSVRCIYYDYKPQPEVFVWEQVGDVSNCPELNINNILVQYVEPPETNSIGTYLLIAEGGKSFEIILNCYNVEGNTALKSSVIKKLNGDIIVAIVEDHCLVSKPNIQLKVVNIMENNYLLIGNWNKGSDPCQYGVCTDCQNKEIHRIFKDFPEIPAGKWTEAGLKWNHDPKTLQGDFPKSSVKKQYKSVGKTAFVLVNNLPDLNPKWLLRTASGVRIGLITIKQSSSNVPDISYYIYTKKSDESKVYSSYDCLAGWEVRPDHATEVWFFYSENESGSGDFEETNEESPNVCPEFDNINILIKEVENAQSEKSNYWNGGTPKIKLKCYDTPRHYAVVTQNDEHILTLENFKCAGIEQDEQNYDGNVLKLYVNTEVGDSSRVVVGMKGADAWCYYGLSRNMEDGDKWVYFNYEPDSSAAQWYKQGECSSVPKVNIWLNQEDGVNPYDMGTLAKTFCSVSHGNYKFLYCYIKENPDPIFSSMMKSASGKHHLTVKGMDCSNFDRFLLNSINYGKHTYLVLGKELGAGQDGCRYDICMDCQDTEIHYNINTLTKPSGDLLWIEMAGNSIEELVDNHGSIQKRAISIEEEKLENNVYEIIMKYVSGDERKLILSCFKKVSLSADGPIYVSVITDARGEFVFKIIDHDCSRNEGHHPATVMYVKEAKEEVYFVLIHKDTYAICQKCENPFIIKTFNNNNENELVKITWTKDALEECLKITRDDISIEENKFQFDESYEVKRYISLGWPQYLLTCYSKTGSEHREYIANIVDVGTNNKHVISIKGIDCSSTLTMEETFFISIHEDKDKILVNIGSRPRSEKTNCKLEVCTGSNECDKEIKFSYDVDVTHLVAKMLQWSQEGIEMDQSACPSPELKGPIADESEKYKPHKVQVHSTGIFILECYESKNGKTSYNTLRTMKGYYVQTLREDCSSLQQVLKEFYVVKYSKSQNKVYQMNQVGIEKVIESCWENENNDDEVKIWFYYFYDNTVGTSLEWETDLKSTSKPPGYSILPFKQEDKKSWVGKLVAEYFNGGRIIAKLSVYRKTDSSYFTTITNTKTGRIIILNECSFESPHKLESIYIDTEEFFTIFGIEFDDPTSSKKKWSYYSLYVKEHDVEVRALKHYSASVFSAQWYKDKIDDCVAIKSGNIITDSGLKDAFEGETPISFFVAAFTYDDFQAITMKNVLSYRCYKKVEEDNEILVLVVTDGYGDHLVTIKRFDCSWKLDEPLYLNFFTVAITQPDTSTNLAVGGRLLGQSTWCQYRFCLDCETQQQQLWQGVTKFKSNLIGTLHWSWSEAEDCPAVKRNNVFTKEDGMDLNGLTALSVYVLSVFSYEYVSVIKFKILETLLIYCYYKEVEGGERKYTMVVRSEEKHHLATVDDYDCSSKISNLNTYLYTYRENDQKLLALGTRSSESHDWCRYNIFLNNYPTTVIRRYVHVASKNVFKWMPEIGIKYSRSQTGALEVTPDDGAKLIAEYESERFGVECYIMPREDAVEKITIILNEGKRIIKLKQIDCQHIEDVTEKIKILNSKDTTDGSVDDLLIGISSPKHAQCCVKDQCVNCKKVSELFRVDSIIDDQSLFQIDKYLIKYEANIELIKEWSQVELDSCPLIPKSNIVTSHTKLNLGNYKKIGSYINLNSVDDDTFVVFCYKSTSSSEGEKILTRIKSVAKGLSVAISDLDCRSKIVLDNISYMTVELNEAGNKNLVLGTRYVVFPIFTGPWCRYDICIDCNERDITINDESDPAKLSTFQWSQAGIKIESPGDPHHGRELASLPLVARYVHMKYNKFNIECRDGSSVNDKILHSVIKFDDLTLVTIPYSKCLGNQLGNFYIYTYNKNKAYSLVRLGPSFKESDFKSLKDIHEQWFYFFWAPESTEDFNWKMVTNLKLVNLNEKDVPESEVSTCLPQDRQMSDFSNTPVLKRSKQN